MRAGVICGFFKQASILKVSEPRRVPRPRNPTGIASEFQGRRARITFDSLRISQLSAFCSLSSFGLRTVGCDTACELLDCDTAFWECLDACWSRQKCCWLQPVPLLLRDHLFASAWGLGCFFCLGPMLSSVGGTRSSAKATRGYKRVA